MTDWLQPLGSFLIGYASLLFATASGLIMTLYMAVVFTLEYFADRKANKIARKYGGDLVVAGGRLRTSGWFVAAAYSGFGLMVVGLADVLTPQTDLRAPIRYLFLLMLFSLMRAAGSGRRMRRESRGEG